jgi:hypothetical protein
MRDERRQDRVRQHNPANIGSSSVHPSSQEMEQLVHSLPTHQDLSDQL